MVVLSGMHNSVHVCVCMCMSINAILAKGDYRCIVGGSNDPIAHSTKG